jgi:hypothetical protein
LRPDKIGRGAPRQSNTGKFRIHRASRRLLQNCWRMPPTTVRSRSAVKSTACNFSDFIMRNLNLRKLKYHSQMCNATIFFRLNSITLCRNPSEETRLTWNRSAAKKTQRTFWLHFFQLSHHRSC